MSRSILGAAVLNAILAGATIESTMSLTEILAAIPTLSFSERQQLVRRAIEVEGGELSAEENAILDERLEDFRKNPEASVAQ